MVYKWLTFTVLHRSSLELKFHCRKSAFFSTPPICSLLNVANLWQRRTNCDPPTSEAPVFLAHASPEEPSLAVSLRNIYFGCKLIPVRCCPLEGLGWPRVAAGNASLCGQGFSSVLYQGFSSTGCACVGVPDSLWPGAVMAVGNHQGAIEDYCLALWAREPGDTQWVRNLPECLLSQVF